ncbi:hypothetical protein ART_2014 [Arthrobacter sp. PAMC 25486]|uniref:HAD domain-containing protein n=1 Tax=Arthrobacter sp. PAMC 25486 TaxID=1494608 RepID=UPI000535E18B|nr:HAD domain-containing protein [Arthrobacter sp. PAMC 25486]AIY01613.1 hypothetical protein ART_2014 [Arthrobacter sp. PAMC 25486]
MVLKAARLVSGGDFEPMQWPTRTLVTLDVDGVLLPMQEWAAEIRVEDFEELTFWQPPLAKPGTFYVDPEALAAVRRWCDLPDADVQWHTSWQEFVHLLAPALGLPPLPLFDYRTNFDVYRNRPWKHFALDVFAGDIPGVRCGGYSQLTIAT